MFKKRNEGFTLVELLIVLAVIAALLAIVTPVAVSAVKRAKETQVASTLRNIAAALQQYYYTEQEMPADLDALKTAKYIQGKTDGYSITTNATNGIATVTYTGGGVTAEGINKVWDEATGTDNNIHVTVRLSKYW